MPGGKGPGPSVKDKELYEKLRDDGNSKEKSARIANSQTFLQDRQQKVNFGLEGQRQQLAVGLGQVGEFGFVLATVAVTRGVLPPAVYAALLAAVAISIAVSSISVRYVRRASPVVASADA